MVSVGGISCCLGAAAAALYLIGWSCQRKADALNSVTRVNNLKDLVQLLDAEGKGLPLVVAVTGRVGSDAPINCENSDLRAVVLEETIEKQYWERNTGRWVRDLPSTLITREEVDWYLDDDTSRVNVVGACGATDSVLIRGSDVFEESGRTLHNHHAIKIWGIRKVEYVLPTGTQLTVVGEAVKDNIGSIRIQRPRNGPFYVTHESTITIDELITNLGIWSRLCTYAAVGLTGGIFLLAKHAIQHILERRLRKRVLDAAKKSEQEETGLNDKADNEADCTSRDLSMPDLWRDLLGA